MDIEKVILIDRNLGTGDFRAVSMVTVFFVKSLEGLLNDGLVGGGESDQFLRDRWRFGFFFWSFYRERLSLRHINSVKPSCLERWTILRVFPETW